MASHAANEYTLTISKQSAKGTPAASPTGFKLGVTGGEFDGRRTFQQLAETDSSIQQGSTQAVSAEISGSPSFYLRPRSFPMFALGVLGANADSGAGPYVHTITPAAATPYFTIWANRGTNTQITKFTDCKITGLSIQLASGGFLTFSATISGLGALFNTTDNAAVLESEAVFVYPEVTILSNPARTAGIVSNLTLDISRNATPVPGDNTWTAYDIANGRLTVGGSFSALWETVNDYAIFNTGTSGGTVFGSTVATESLTVTATKSASAIFQAVLAGIMITQIGQPVSPGGEPVIAAYTFEGQRQATLAGLISILCTNSLATVPGA